MKKIIGIIAIILCIAIIPVFFLVCCKKDDYDTKSIVNRTYYVTKVMRDNQNVSTMATNDNMRINFGNNFFKVEIGQEAIPSSYGFYTGTYSIDENDISLTIKTYGGIWANAQSSSAKKDFVLKSLIFQKGKLHTEFINNNDILQYTLESPN